MRVSMRVQSSTPTQAGSRRRWRYAVAGGVVALALTCAPLSSAAADPDGGADQGAGRSADDPVPSKQDIDAARERADGASERVATVQAKLASANERLRKLDVRAQTAVENYNAAAHELTLAKKDAAVAERKATRAKRAVDKQRREIGRYAAAEYQRQGGLREIGAYLNADGPQTLLDEAAVHGMVTRAQVAAYRKLANAKAASAVAKKRSAAAVRAQAGAARKAKNARAEAEQAVQTQQNSVGATRSRQQRLVVKLARLQNTSVELAEERQDGLAAAAAKRAAERARDDERDEQFEPDEPEQPAPSPQVPDDTEPSPPEDPDPPEPPDDPEPTPPSSGGAAAVEFAEQQMGEPYIFGAAGPDTWDCSGLTMQAWNEGGVSMPHTARGQYRQSASISADNLRPGDLIFWSDDGSVGSIYHVALYSGDGQMIHAPRPGRSVETKSVWYMGEPSHYARPY